LKNDERPAIIVKAWVIGAIITVIGILIDLVVTKRAMASFVALIIWVIIIAAASIIHERRRHR